MPVLLPSALPSTLAKVRLYGFASATRSGYDVTLASRPRCGANACFVGSFSAKRGRRAQGARAVRLAGGRRGRYTPLSCGASCSPPSIEWSDAGVVYRSTLHVEYRVRLSSARERTLMLQLANSAIAAGPR